MIESIKKSMAKSTATIIKTQSKRKTVGHSNVIVEQLSDGTTELHTVRHKYTSKGSVNCNF